jgi:hypothetical protein
MGKVFTAMGLGPPGVLDANTTMILTIKLTLNVLACSDGQQYNLGVALHSLPVSLDGYMDHTGCHQLNRLVTAK